MEIVPRLDADSCLNAIMRFIVKKASHVKRTVTTGQTLSDLNKNLNLQSTLRHGQRTNRKPTDSTGD